MWTISFRLRRGLVWAVIIALTIVAVMFTLKACTQGDSGRTDSVSDSKLTGRKLKNNDQRLAFLAELGWEVNPAPVETAEVAIPDIFDDVYTEYNRMQGAQGFDLTPFKGVRVKRYSYEILNYPGEAKDIRLTLYLYKDKLIAGDVYSTQQDGLLHGLNRPQPEAQELEDSCICGMQDCTCQERGEACSCPST